MKLGTVRRILKEDISRFGDTPKWINALLSPLNDFLEQVTRALENRLTFEDNFSGVVKSVELTNGVEKEVSPQSALRVTGAIPLYASGKQITGFGISLKSSGMVGVTATFSAGGTANCTILILLG